MLWKVVQPSQNLDSELTNQQADVTGWKKQL